MLPRRDHRIERRFTRVALLTLLGVLLVPITAHAGRVTLAWDAAPSVGGYTVYWGTAPGVYTQSIDVGNTTTYTVQSLTNGVRFYFVVKSYAGGVFSAPSNEVNAIPSNVAPSILNPGNITMRSGPLNLPISASDADFDVLTFTATGLPAGLTISGTTGVISGTVPVGTHSVTVTARDGVLQASTSFTITATANAAPTLAAVSNQTNDTNDVVSLQLAGSDADGDPLTYSATGLPTGLTMNATTGRISGTPANGTGGTHNVTATVSDGALTASRSFTWTVVDLNPGLVAAFGFEEGSGTSAADRSNNGNTGTISGATWTTSGKFGKALSFDGVNDWVTIAHAPELSLTTGMTLEAWVYPTVNGNGLWRAVVFKEQAGSLVYALNASDAVDSLPVYEVASAASGVIAARGGSQLPLNAWTHLAATYDGTTMRVFVNGVQVGTTAGSGNLLTSTGSLRIGGNIWGGYFQGRIDEVRIFNVARTAAQITADMNAAIVGGPPVLTNPGNRTNAENAAISLQLVASDPDGDAITYSASGLPPSLTVNATTGLISGTLSYTSAGSHSVTVTATAAGGSDSKTFTWTVTNTNRAPVVTNPGAQTSSQGVADTLAMTATDADGQALTFSATGLPTGMSINASTGVVSGTPTAAGTFSTVVTVSDGTASPTVSFTWTVTGNPPTLTNPGNRTNAENAVISLQLVASDPDGDAITYSATGLPPSLTVNATTGLISGTLSFTSAGTHTVTVTATAAAASDSKTFTWTVTNTNRAPVVTNPGAQTSNQGVADTLAMTATDADGQALTFSATGLPTGLSINAATGVVTGTPTAAGTFTTVVTVSDGTASPTVSFTWTVTGNPPTLTNPGNRTNAENAAISLQLVASDPDGDAITYSASGLPPSLTVNATTGLISGTLSYSSAGSHSVTVTATAAGVSDSKTFTWTVTNTNRAPVVTNPGAQASFQGVAASLSIAATDADGQALTFSATGLPTGMSINASTGVVTGTPTSIGSFSTVVTVSDGTASPTVSFTWTVSSPLPGTATPLTPSGTITSATPSFTWSALPNIGYYYIEITDADPGSPTGVWVTPADGGCPLGTGTCTMPSPRTLTKGVVTWQILTWNSFGWGQWSAVKQAVVNGTDATVPAPAAIDPSGPVLTRTPTYRWNPVANATWYQISVTDALNVNRQFWTSPAAGCAATPCTMTPTPLLAVGPAQWRVRAWSATGAGAWTSWMAFETASEAPGQATLIAPDGPIGLTTPTFTWNGVDGTSYYVLRTIDLNNVETDLWYKPADAGCPSGAEVCTVTPGVALAPGMTRWQVLTWNVAGYGPWSDIRTFSVEIADPQAGVASTIAPAGSLTSALATYRWSRVSSAVMYRLAISVNGGAATYWWYTPAALGCTAVGPCSATPADAGLRTGTASWQVQAWTSKGYGAWSAAVPLVVNIPVPPTPVPLAPNGAAVSTTSFTWSPSANATYYYVVASDSTGVRIDRWLTPVEAGCASEAVTCTLISGLTLNSGSGSWQVLAYNPTGYSEWSALTAFVIP